MVSQLRIFTIAGGKMDDFVKAWRDGVYPLRLMHGFTIDGAWILEDSDKFAWILSYDGPEEWAVKDRAYYASTDRHSVDPDPRQYIVKVESYFITPLLLPTSTS
jgi:hypothetical protein